MSGRLLQDHLFAIQHSILTGCGTKELRALYAMDVEDDRAFQKGYVFQLVKRECLAKEQFLTRRLHIKYQYLMCQIDWIFIGNRHENIRLELGLPDEYNIAFGDAIVWYHMFMSTYVSLVPEKYYCQNYLFGVFLRKWLDLYPEDQQYREQLETELLLSERAMGIILGQSPKSVHVELMDIMYETVVEMRDDLVLTREELQ